jgi:hypothetical protein
MSGGGESMRTHYEIPATFDGEMLQMAFRRPDAAPPLVFGRRYRVPTSDGQEVRGRLYDAAVNELKKEVLGCYQLENGECIMATCPISDEELEAYRNYLDTFFGVPHRRAAEPSVYETAAWPRSVRNHSLEHPDQIGDPITYVQDSLAAMDAKIAPAQVHQTKSEPRQHLSAAVLISLLALLFSFGTTTVSYIHTKRQDIHDARAELRSLIQRLNQIPIDNIEYGKKYETDPLTVGILSGRLNTENALVAKQAKQVIDRIPDYVGGTEYSSVAMALALSGLAEPALQLVKLGLSKSTDVNDEVMILRQYGMLLFSIGDLEGGREKYQAALSVFTKYSSTNQYYIQTTHAQTEMFWSQIEAGSRQCANAKLHLAQARSRLSQLPPGSNIKIYEDQIDKTESAQQTCVP